MYKKSQIKNKNFVKYWIFIQPSADNSIITFCGVLYKIMQEQMLQ